MLVSKKSLEKHIKKILESNEIKKTEQYDILKQILETGMLLDPPEASNLFREELGQILSQYEIMPDFEDHQDALDNVYNFLEFFENPSEDNFSKYILMDLPEIESIPSIKSKMEKMIKIFKQAKNQDWAGAFPAIINFKNKIKNPSFEQSLLSTDLKQTREELGEPSLHNLFMDLYITILQSRYYTTNYYTAENGETPYILKILDSYRSSLESGYNVRIVTDKFVSDLKSYAITMDYSFDDDYIEEIAELSSEISNAGSVNYIEKINRIIAAFSFKKGDIPPVHQLLKSIPDFEVFKKSIDVNTLDIDSSSKEVKSYYPARQESKKRWGVQGSGILLITKPDPETKLYRELLLQQRAMWVTGGKGKWAYPGGAFNPLTLKGSEKELARKVIEDDLGISSIDAIQYEKFYQADNTPVKLDTNNTEHLKILLSTAMVEFEEEVGVSLKSIGPIDVKKVIINKTYDWNYATFIIEVDVNQKALILSNIKEDSESIATRWVPIEDILFKEGVGKNLWDVAFNSKVISTIKQYGTKIESLYKQYDVKEQDIPSEESLGQIVKFLNYMTENPTLTEKELLDKANASSINLDDLVKVMMTIAIHTKSRGGVDAMRNLETLESVNKFGIVRDLFTGRPLNFIMLLSQSYPGLLSRELDAKDAIIGNRIVRRISSIKGSVDNKLKVYRGIASIPSKEIMFSLMYPGAEYFLGNNVSTSIDEFSASDFLINPSIMYHINIDKSSSIAASSFSYFRDEKEVLVSGNIKVKSFRLNYINVAINGTKVSGTLTEKDGLELAQKLIYYCYENQISGRLSCVVHCDVIGD